MDVKVGTTAGFVAALGGIGGAMFGYLAGSVVGLPAKDQPAVTGASAIIGGLVGAFVGGSMAAPDPVKTLAGPLLVSPNAADLAPGSTTSDK